MSATPRHLNGAADRDTGRVSVWATAPVYPMTAEVRSWSLESLSFGVGGSVEALPR